MARSSTGFRRRTSCGTPQPEPHPTGKLVPAEDLCSVVLFLASEESRSLTGQTILVDGGLSTGSALLSLSPHGRP
ncbi:SDR family oxidoreductase [Haloactinospora alba]|uniref:SDR family oxidoreductase n=1 Tax=Haloactinospora alba TaxID=405555 RepID=UPI00114E8FFD